MLFLQVLTHREDGNTIGGKSALQVITFVNLVAKLKTYIFVILIAMFLYSYINCYSEWRGKKIDAGKWRLLYYHNLLGEWQGIVTHRKGG